MSCRLDSGYERHRVRLRALDPSSSYRKCQEDKVDAVGPSRAMHYHEIQRGPLPAQIVYRAQIRYQYAISSSKYTLSWFTGLCCRE